MNFFRILALSILIARGARAESFSPETATVFALGQNKDLVAARYLIAEAEGRLVQAGLWKNPEFELATEFDARDREGDRRVAAGFMQKFPLAGRLAKARAVARVDVAMAIEELRDKERMLAGQVLGKTRALLVLDRKLSINDENRALLGRILQQTTSLAAVGKADSGDARVIELEQTTLALAREGIVVERRAMLAEVNGLLGRAPAADLTISGDLPSVPSAETLGAAARAAPELRPDRRLAALQVDK
jgi:cobalt-zinc-cadmium efflux system outer membrane protein